MVTKAEVEAFILAEFPQSKCVIREVGRSLAVGEVSLYSEGLEEPVAHVVGTYSIPPHAHS